jgi:hypothetical protein
VGDGADNRSISGVGFQPVWVLTFADSKDSFFRPAALLGDASYKIAGYGALANRIQALEADGFQIGSNGDVNQSGQTYHYVAWKASSQVSAGNYTGDGSDNRSITGVGLPPAFVWVKRFDTNQATWRPASVGGDLSLHFDALNPGNNRIQALEADGFQVGGHGQVNTAGATYFHLALRDDAGAGRPTPTPTTCARRPWFVHCLPASPAPHRDRWGTALTRHSWGVAWGDYDNDGWPDVYYGRHAGLKSSLYHNLGNGTFEDVAPTSGIQIKLDRHGCAWGDYDADGYLDLMCTGGFPGPRTIVLWHNNGGNGTFTDVATAAGISKTDMPDTLSGRSITWLDYDLDGRLDFFNNGEFKKNVLGRNLGGWPSGHFSNVAVQPLQNFANSMQESSSSVDYDNDNRWAFVVSFSSPGTRPEGAFPQCGGTRQSTAGHWHRGEVRTAEPGVTTTMTAGRLVRRRAGDPVLDSEPMSGMIIGLRLYRNRPRRHLPGRHVRSRASAGAGSHGCVRRLQQ